MSDKIEILADWDAVEGQYCAVIYTGEGRATVTADTRGTLQLALKDAVAGETVYAKADIVYPSGTRRPLMALN